MSGLEKIIARLEAENEAACAEIAAGADARVSEILAEAQAKGNAAIREAEEDARRKAAALVSRAESAGALAGRRELLAAKVELVNEVLEAAADRLRALPADRYFETLAALAVKNRQAGQGVLYLGEADLRRAPESFRVALGDGISLSDTPAPIADGFLLKYGDIELNCPFDALFAAARETLKAEAGELLFG